MNNTTTTTTFSLPTRLRHWWTRRADSRRARALRRRYVVASIAAERIPPAVRIAWARMAPDEFPGLAVDDGTWLRCALGLSQFFEVCRRQQASGPCALPSKAADSVWHVWLTTDPAGLAEWQQRCFGRVVEHRDVQALGEPLESCLARSWVGACGCEGLSPLGPRLPLLFALDGWVGVPTGWAYRHRRGTLAHQQIDGFGRPVGREVLHAGMAGGVLVAAGLMTAAELKAEERRRQASEGGSSGGSDGWSVDVGSDACDAASDTSSGSSCGSSCGSGCGGGGD